MAEVTTVVIGAGPYGLSVGAHLHARGVPTRVFGKPMEFWHQMPARMYLKSVWTASTFSDPAGKYSLNRYTAAIHSPRQEPIPLPYFLDYGHWFQQQAVPEVDPTYVQLLARDGQGFHLDLADGRTAKARRVVVATGVSAFTHVPDFARDLPATLASHTQFHQDFSRFQGKNVAVIGCGQSGLETAALLHEAGATVELIARESVIWIDRRLYRATGPMRHLFYPPSDVGPPGINWLTAFPSLYRHLPTKTREAFSERAIRPAGADWLRSRVEGVVKITPLTSITRAAAQGQAVRLELSDGTTREIDYLFLGTGYEPNVRKLAFIDPALQEQIATENGFPLLNPWFESSIPGLYFVGALGGFTFGPICRFVAGSGATAQQVAGHAARAN
jgi:cation diffusion facilitator CzcD-associated flavoprotein CzcO